MFFWKKEIESIPFNPTHMYLGIYAAELLHQWYIDSSGDLYIACRYSSLYGIFIEEFICERLLYELNTCGQ